MAAWDPPGSGESGAADAPAETACRRLLEHTSRLARRIGQVSSALDRFESDLISQSQGDSNAELLRINAELADAYSRTLATVVDLAEKGGLTSHLSWDDTSWTTRAMSRAVVPGLVRVGSVVFDVEPDQRFPALLSARHNLVVSAPGVLRSRGVEVARSLSLRLLTELKPGLRRLVIVDLRHVGRSVLDFVRLVDCDPAVVEVVTDETALRTRLEDIRRRIEWVFLELLRDRYPDLSAFNAQVESARAEHFTTILLLGSVDDLSTPLRHQLDWVQENGPQTGVTTVRLDASGSMALGEAGETPGAPTAFKLVLSDTGRADLHLPDGTSVIPIDLDNDPPPAVFRGLVAQLAKELETRVDAPLPLVRILDPAGASSADGISIPVGMAGDSVAKVEFDDRHVHGLATGRTGRGKSAMLHTLILSGAARYSSDELQFWLVDLTPRSTEFSVYAPDGEGVSLPHVAVVGTDARQEDGVEVLAAASRLLEERAAEIRRCQEEGSQDVTDLATYRASGRGTMPRIVLIVDEFQQLFQGDNRLGGRAWNDLRFIIRQGRKYGVHVLLCTQTLRGLADQGSTMRELKSQIDIRIALASDEEESGRILMAGNNAAAELHRPGEAILNSQAGDRSANRRTQIAYADAAERKAIRERLSESSAESGVVSFSGEGGPPLDLHDRADIRTFVKGWAFPLGVEVSVRRPLRTVDATFSRDPLRHLVVLSRNELDGRRALAQAGEVYRFAHEQPTLVVVDSLLGLANAADSPLRQAGLDTGELYGEAEVGSFFFRVARALAAGGARPQLILAAGLERFDLAVPTRFPSDEPLLGRDLTAVLKNGAQSGVHVVSWWTGDNAIRSLPERPNPPGWSQMMLLMDIPVEELKGFVETVHPLPVDPSRHVFIDRATSAGALRYRPYRYQNGAASG